MEITEFSISISAMKSRSLIILAVIINVSYKIDASLNGIPRDTEVKVNDSTYMNCSTSLHADQVQWRHGKNYIFTGITILEPYNDRFSVQINASTGACNLVIRSVQTSDAGTYECSEDEGFGEKTTAQLIVLDDDPVCRSNINSDGVIGPNSCGIEKDEVELSCSTTYHGNSLPVLRWKAIDDNQSITDGKFNVTSRHKEVTYTLTMNTSVGLNNSSYICQTTRTSDEHYSCYSEVIHISYVFSNNNTVNMTMNDEVSCFANTSQSCSYKWKWFSGDDISTESENQILKPKKGGMHRCEATCSIRNKSCTVESMSATVYSATGTSGKNLMPLLTLLALPAIGVYCLVKSCRRKREQKQEQEERILNGQERDEEDQRIPDVIATITTKAAEKRNRSIQGLTILNKELFVVSYKSSEVEVFDSIEFTFIRRWNLKELICPWNMVSCEMNKCLYIHTSRGGIHNDNYFFWLEESFEILKVGLNGKLIKKWPAKQDYGSLSGTYKSDVIFTVSTENKLGISEYSSDGIQLREINLLSEEGFNNLKHAIKLTNGNFVVSQGSSLEKGEHRVCIVDGNGKLLKSYGKKRGPALGQLDCPEYLSVGRNGFVMVADRLNHRVLLLDSHLKFNKILASTEEIRGLQDPNKILLDESNGRLFVADNFSDNPRIIVLKVGY